MITKTELFDRLGQMAEQAIDISSTVNAVQIKEMRDLPDQYQGLSPFELEQILKNPERITCTSVDENPHWDPRSIEGLKKAGYAMPKEVEQDGEEKDAAELEMLPHDLEWADVPVKEDDTNYSILESILEAGEELELELADGTVIVLDPAALTKICEAKTKFFKSLGSTQKFSAFLTSLYGGTVAVTHDDHTGNGGVSDFAGGE